MEWKLADAKTRFSEVVRLALSKGPQHILRRNDAVVVMSEEEYERLAGSRQSFKDLLFNGPDLDGLDLTRDKSAPRDVEL